MYTQDVKEVEVKIIFSQKQPNEGKLDDHCNFKLLKNILLKILKPIIEDKNMIPEHQFSFIDRYRIIDIIENRWNKEQFVLSPFLMLHMLTPNGSEMLKYFVELSE
ncbi:hypothetical protein JTB14_011562 [Gonioctena quinquepunctata]|nr:hypothetical protein JTB14_011562 [Gonioctena quinquepunctata]